jgi:hypothetical protein
MRPKSPPAPLRWIFAAVILVTTARADDSSRLEDRVRAAFLFNFTHFVVWQDPERVAPDGIVVAVEGGDGVEAVLRQMTDGEDVGGAPVKVTRLPPDALGRCHIFYLAGACDRATVARWLGPSPRSGVLTVGDAPGFLEQGGIIRFHMTGNRIRFEVSLENAKKAGIKLSSKLIQVSQRSGDP